MPNSREKILLGRRGEKLARKFLKKKGFRHLCSNFSTDRGEIDLIMQDNDSLVFIEVKTRSSEEFASAEESVNFPKQKHLTAAARSFIQANNLHDFPCRFDVVSITLPPQGKPTFRHFPNAFKPTR